MNVCDLITRSAVVSFLHAAANTLLEHFIQVPSDELLSLRMTSPSHRITLALKHVHRLPWR